MDSRLQSVHLDYPRRQEFRQAREEILQARGNETLLHEGEAIPANLDRKENDDSRANTASFELAFRFALMDGAVVYPLKIGLNTLGRSSNNDVILPEHYISRRHCAIVVHATSGCEVFDLASRNGTFLNDVPLKAARRLKSGDHIRICDRRLIFIENKASSHFHDHDTQQIS